MKEVLTICVCLFQQCSNDYRSMKFGYTIEKGKLQWLHNSADLSENVVAWAHTPRREWIDACLWIGIAVIATLMYMMAQVSCNMCCAPMMADLSCKTRMIAMVIANPNKPKTQNPKNHDTPMYVTFLVASCSLGAFTIGD